MLVVGDKELENNAVAVRTRSGGDEGVMALDEFINRALEEIQTKK